MLMFLYTLLVSPKNRRESYLTFLLYSTLDFLFKAVCTFWIPWNVSLFASLRFFGPGGRRSNSAIVPAVPFFPWTVPWRVSDWADGTGADVQSQSIKTMFTFSRLGNDNLATTSGFFLTVIPHLDRARCEVQAECAEPAEEGRKKSGGETPTRRDARGACFQSSTLCFFSGVIKSPSTCSFSLLPIFPL